MKSMITSNMIEKSDRLSGIFLGEVINDKHPNGDYLVQVKVFGLTDSITGGDLPWYYVKKAVGIGADKYNSSIGIPQKGTHVIVEFLDTTNIYSGIVTGEIRNADTRLFNQGGHSGYEDPIFSEDNTGHHHTYSSNFEEDYPNTYGWIDRTLNWIRVNMIQKFTEMVHSSSSKFKIDKNGNVTLHVTGDFKLVVDGNTTLKTTNFNNLVSDTTYFHYKVWNILLDDSESKTVSNNVNHTIGSGWTMSSSTTSFTTTMGITGVFQSSGSITCNSDIRDSEGSLSSLRSIYESHTHTDSIGGSTNTASGNGFSDPRSGPPNISI